jgi:para-nitrobenzyl esterase
VLALYPHSTPEEVERSATDLASDRFIVYSTWKWFDLHRNHSDKGVYRYLYSKLRPPLKEQGKVAGLAGGTMDAESDAPAAPEPIGAPHACEIEYCMGNLSLVDDYVWTADDYKVSETMQAFFVNFIKKGDPNSLSLPNWSAAEANDPEPPVMVIDTKSQQIDAPSDARFDFHNSYYNQ